MLCAPAVLEAESNGLQQHAARLHVTTAVHCSRFHCIIHSLAQATFTGMIHETQPNSQCTARAALQISAAERELTVSTSVTSSEAK